MCNLTGTQLWQDMKLPIVQQMRISVSSRASTWTLRYLKLLPTRRSYAADTEAHGSKIANRKSIENGTKSMQLDEDLTLAGQKVFTIRSNRSLPPLKIFHNHVAYPMLSVNLQNFSPRKHTPTYRFVFCFCMSLKTENHKKSAS